MSPPRPDYARSLDFLKWWAHKGFWVLTAIHPETGGIETRTFSPDQEQQAQGWLEKKGQEHNLYFSVNPVLRKLRKKPLKVDIAAMAWLHVDVDPQISEDLETEEERLEAIKQEQARILTLFQETPKNIPPPTCLVFSGGGYQGFWKLKKPIRLDGQEKLAEEAERYNRELEACFGADPCHNVDRIMRLPGSINWPNEKKRKKGRKPALAQLVEAHEDRAYSLSSFAQARPLGEQAPSSASRNGTATAIPTARQVELDELPRAVPDNVKAAIREGKDPEDPSKHPSRSEWLFWVCCELVRSEVDDDTIFSLITDKRYRISDSVYDYGGRAQRYAARQVRRARDHAVDPSLSELNDKHAVIESVGGRCRIISEEHDPALNRSRVTFQSFADFRNRYCHRNIEYAGPKGKVVQVPLGHWWVHHSRRRQYDTIVFVPGKEVELSYNLWQGYPYEPEPGDCSLYLEHIKQNICQSNEEHFDYLIRWMANAIQHPDSPGHVAVVLRGRQGTGKGVFARNFMRLFGRHYMHISDPKHLVGNFNAHLRDCVLLFADEAFYAGDRRHESVLKMLVTEENITVELKGVDAEAAPNYVHLIMASNSDWVVPAGFDERRFFVLDVSEDQKQNTEYFGKVQRQMDNGGYEALMHHLMNIDLKGFDVRTMPRTQALQDQMILSFNPEEEWWFSKLVQGEVFEGESWPEFVFASRLVYDYASYRRVWQNNARSNSTRLGKFLSRVFPPKHRHRGQYAGTVEVVQEDGSLKTVNRPRIYLLPTLEVCRRHWDQEFGGPYDWSDPELYNPPAVPF